MIIYPWAYDNRAFLIADDRFQVAYYSRDRKKYKRVRDTDKQNWEDTVEEQIDHDSFWMVVACAELAKLTRR